MSSRLHICPSCLRATARSIVPRSNTRNYASVQAISPAPSFEQMHPPIATLEPYPATQPPSHRPPEYRKSQLHRQYTSLLRSTPLFLLFQHNNLKAVEWMAIRRELAAALRKVDNTETEKAEGIKLQTIQTGIFASALKVVEYFNPDQIPDNQASKPSSHSRNLRNHTNDPSDPSLKHFLSRTAHKATKSAKPPALMPLLCGPLALLSFPVVSTAHLKTALSILAPNAPNFPAPTRRANPGYHDPLVQAGLQKLLLLAARVEGRVFDTEGTRWVGSISGGLDGLRAELVMVLQSFGGGLTSTLEGVGRTLYFTMEGRKGMLEDAEKPAAAEAPAKEEEVKA